MINRTTLRESWHSWVRADGRKAGPRWLHLLWTAVFSCALGLIFTFVGFVLHARDEASWLNLHEWVRWLAMNSFVSLCIGYTIHFLFAATRSLLGTRRLLALQGWRRVAYYAGVPLVGVYVAWPVSIWILGGRFTPFFGGNTRLVIGSLLFSIFVTFVIYQFFSAYNRRLNAERQAVEARLKLLQSQIEPHFLFNTLANVVSLIDHEPPRARRMLEEFIAYLRATLDGSRRDRATLGEEAALVEHYLGLLRIRMGERLQFHVDVPQALRGTVLPPLSVQPLVENAVLHGLEPKVEGGTVTVRARQVGDQVWIEVTDDGLGLDGSAQDGMAQQPGAGLGMRNTRDRIVNLFGPEAGLDLESRAPGVLARIRVPAQLVEASCQTR
jgi:hypothetical protein